MYCIINIIKLALVVDFTNIHLHVSDNKIFLVISGTGRLRKICNFLLLNINILILHYASMQSEIDETDSLKICIARLEVENAELRKKFAEIEARNAELKARIAKLEDMQIQNELIKNLLSVSRKT